MQPVCDDYFKDLATPPGWSSLHLNPNVRGYLDAVREHLLGLHDSGVAARSVNEEHADLVDRLVRKLFRLAEDRYFAESPRLNFRLAVIAVGGYGRRELSLGSDIDLLFLHRGKLNPYVETVAEVIAHRLWDARLSVGVATRTLQDCMRVGREDLPTLTSYLDARFVIGDPGLFSDLDEAVHRRIKDHAREFIAGKLEEQRSRHERFGESLYLLQPNLRESVGGLRDYHTALWVARPVHWEVRRAEHLHLHGFIDAEELTDLLVALDFMWRIRNELHRDGRKDDRLHYDAQERLARALGLGSRGEDGSQNGALPVERLMRTYYLHARAIERVSARVADHALALAERRRGERRSPVYAVEEGFAIADGRLEIPGAQILQARPARLLSAFVVAQQRDVDLSARAQRLLRQHVRLIDDDLRADPEAAELFRRLLCGERRVYRSLKLMNELGLLGAYIPEFGHLMGMWQHDMYHTYTTDVHSLFLVEQLRRLLRGRFAEELPLATELMREVRDPTVLYLGCVLHDIGKGRGGGHSEKGAALSTAVCERLGLDAEESDSVTFLVRHHLTMSEMAERRDVHDPRQILKLAGLAGTREQLRRLYLLTVADIRSVSPVAWTTWKGGLIAALYRNAAEWLEAGAEETQAMRFFLERAAARVAAAEREVTERLATAGRDRQRVTTCLDAMPRRYLLNHAVSEVMQHVEAALDFLDSDARCGVYTFAPPRDDDPFWGLVVFARDQRGLLATVTGVLAACGHDIMAAQAYTSRGDLAVQIYEVQPLAGGPAEEEHERSRIETSLREVLEGVRSLEPLVAARESRVHRVRAHVPAVRVSNDESDFYTVVDVRANDRPALLYDITRTLAAGGLDVHVSRVSTRADRADDAFYVTDSGHKVADPDRRQEIERALLRAIRGGAG